MSIPGLKEKLIEKIRLSDNEVLLEGLSSLLQMQDAEAVYELSEEQRQAVTEA